MTIFRYPDDPRPPQREWASNDDDEDGGGDVKWWVSLLALAVWTIAVIFAGMTLGWITWGMGQ